MTRFARRGQDTESGVVLVIFAITMVVLLGLIAIAIDGSYGFVQNRRAQNAADFAAFAAAEQLTNSTYCNGTTTPSTHDLALIVQQLVDDNGSGIGSAWTAQFLNGKGQPVLDANGQPVADFTASSGPTTPPPGACGVSVDATPKWTPFFAGIFGIHQFGGFASAKVSTTAQGKPIGIVALNEYGPHEILGGGTGTFIVEGDIFANTNVSNPPATETEPWTEFAGPYQWDDAIDAKTDSNLYVYGTINTNDGLYNGYPLWPLDHCFINQVAPLAGAEAGTPGSGPTAPSQGLPTEQPPCGVGTVTVDYNAIDNSFPQMTDPLQASTAPASPLGPSAGIGCPGLYNTGLPVTYDTVTQVPGVTTELLPGIYPNPVELTGNVNFQDCSGYATEGLYPGEQAYPGVYTFEGGLWINPDPGDQVTGLNVIIGTQSPYPLAGNVPGSLSGGTFTATGAGNGAPCLPSNTQSSAASGGESETSSTACSGTNSSLYGVTAYDDKATAVDPNIVGTGDNLSLMIGGGAGSSVNLSGPTSGPYAGTDGSPGIVFYQDPGTPANYGFDAQTGDAATITLTGVVYNASLAAYGLNSPRDYWDGNLGGIPFYDGGTLQTGFGAGWTSSNGPTPSTGSVTLNGTAIVDDFNTDGNTGITIVGQPYKLPGGGLLSLIG